MRRGHKALGWLLVGLIASLLVFNVGYHLTYYIMSQAPQENRTTALETVRAVCDLAYDNESEPQFKTCYAAQEAAQAEFICPTAYASHIDCHVEDKRTK